MSREAEKLYLELGCGKGRFTVDTAASMPEVFYVAVEKVPDAMIIAMERAMERGLDNLRFIQRRRCRTLRDVRQRVKRTEYT